MSWKSALSKIEAVLGLVQPEIPIIGGIVGALLPGSKAKVDAGAQKVEDSLATASTVIMSVGATTTALGLKGPDKLKAAAPQIAKVLLTVGPFAGLKIQNQDLFNQAATKIADGLADAWNAVHPDAVSTENIPS